MLAQCGLPRDSCTCTRTGVRRVRAPALFSALLAPSSRQTSSDQTESFSFQSR